MSESIQERIARLKAAKLQALKDLHTQLPNETQQTQEHLSPSLQKALDVLSHGHKEIILNDKQQSAVDLAKAGKSFCLAGAAGTGKTTTTKAIIEALTDKEDLPRFSTSTRYLTAGRPAIVVTAFTKRATKNAEEAIQNPNITSVNFHKLLEYIPNYYESIDKEGNPIKTMRFEPKYNQLNKLPFIGTIIIDESSQFSIPMFETLWAALSSPEKTQFIFIGDIQQIPPTMGTSIYGPKLNELDSIELTQVYRQALESPIIRFLTDMRSGHTITRNDWKKYTRHQDSDEPNHKMRMGVFPPSIDWEDALHQAASFLRQEFEAGHYNPYEDMVLVPFNVKFGTKALNKAIAEMLDAHESRTIHPIIVGWSRAHYAIGDHVLFRTEDYVITDIRPNPQYRGTPANPPSQFIDREGAPFDRKAYEQEQLVHSMDLDLTDHPAEDAPSVPNPISLEDFLMAQAANFKEEKTNTASHIVTLQSLDDPESQPIKLASVGELMDMILSYCITVHKAQGLQAPRVYFFLHKSHSPMHFRELIYTAASRAKEYLTIICDPKVLAKGIDSQRIPGTTLEEKKEHFIKLLGDPSDDIQ